jgi:hypothetical protein
VYMKLAQISFSCWFLKLLPLKRGLDCNRISHHSPERSHWEHLTNSGVILRFVLFCFVLFRWVMCETGADLLVSCRFLKLLP